MTREEARKIAHKLLGKWAKCDDLDNPADDEMHSQVCDTVTDNVLSGYAGVEKLLAGSSRPPGW